MDEFGTMVEWYWQGKPEVLGEKHYTAWVVDWWMRLEQWWNDTDKENWITGRKTLYSVGGRWMNEFGAVVELYWQGKSEVLEDKHFTAWVVDEWMSMEQWWNDTDRGKLNYWKINIIQRVLWMNEWVWSNGGMILTGETWNTGSEICPLLLRLPKLPHLIYMEWNQYLRC